MTQVRKAGVWVKASERLPERPKGDIYQEIFSREIKTGRKKILGWGPIPQRGGQRRSLLIYDSSNYEWLDESAGDTHLEAVEFAEWIADNNYIRTIDTKEWFKAGLAGSTTHHTTKQLYNLYKQQSK